MTVTLCTSGSVALKAGANATILPDSNYTEFINQAEGSLCVDTRVDWVSVYSGISANYKKIIEAACAAKAAIDVINYDMSGFTSVNEATTMINVNLGTYDRAVATLKDANIYKPFGGTPLST